jgi:hypothetical protein
MSGEKVCEKHSKSAEDVLESNIPNTGSFLKISSYF